MTSASDRSVDELRRESERSRTELTQTVAALRTKITETAGDIRETVRPENIKAEISGYVAETGQHWLDAMKRQAMENPMQAVAAGAAIAVPALRLVRSIPLPLLMIGAGLAITSPRVRKAVTDQLSEGLEAAAGADAADAVRDGVSEAAARAQGAVNQARDAIEGTRDALAAKVDAVREQALGGAEVLKDRAASVADQTKAQLQSGLAEASAQAASLAATARDKANAGYERTREAARDNVAWVGGIGLAVGALIAASLPASRVERKSMAAASGALRDTVAAAADNALDKIKTAAMTAVDTATAKVGEADIGGPAVRAAERAGETLKKVTDDAVTTAFEPNSHATR